MGLEMEEGAESGGPWPPSQPQDPEGTPYALCPPSPTSGAAEADRYLRMVCVMDVWRCSPGRRSSGWGEGMGAVSAGILTLRRKA